MTYHTGISEGFARATGLEPGELRASCDGCGMVASGVRADGSPRAWVLDGRGPPKWRTVGAGTPERRDFCPKCRGDR